MTRLPMLRFTLMTLANQLNRKTVGFTRDTLVNPFCETH